MLAFQGKQKGAAREGNHLMQPDPAAVPPGPATGSTWSEEVWGKQA
jgi:hypothetical protein